MCHHTRRRANLLDDIVRRYYIPCADMVLLSRVLRLASFVVQTLIMGQTMKQVQRLNGVPFYSWLFAVERPIVISPRTFLMTVSRNGAPCLASAWDTSKAMSASQRYQFEIARIIDPFPRVLGFVLTRGLRLLDHARERGDALSDQQKPQKMGKAASHKIQTAVHSVNSQAFQIAQLRKEACDGVSC